MDLIEKYNLGSTTEDDRLREALTYNILPECYEKPQIKIFVEYRDGRPTRIWGPPWIKWFPWRR